MSDGARIRFSAACSAVFHLAILASLAYAPSGGPGALASQGEPLVLQLRPPEPTPPHPQQFERLVNPGTPATEPVTATDQISTHDAKASDMSNSGRDEHAPAVDKVADYTSPEGGALEAAPSPPPQPKNQKEDAEQKVAAQPKEAEIGKARPPAPNPDEPQKDRATRVLASESKKQSTEKRKEGAEESKPAEEFKIAKAEPPPAPESPMPSADTGPSSGLVQGGVKNPGFLGFEAKKSEYAPYLREIKLRVEKRWRTTLQMRYSGTSATQAIVDCAIDPDGKLVSIQIVDPGNSVSFAPLCRESIEKAAPFPAFPFRVPDAYRSKNLEIRWVFNFM